MEGSMALIGWLQLASFVTALVLFALAAYNVPARPNLTALGLAFLVAGFILGGAAGVPVLAR
jgi:hypothetical protein